jgi:pyruvate dehydrogenase E1 component alpha subunit
VNSSKELVLRFYRSMAEIRQFELIAREIYRSGRMPGFIHIYVGEEAVAWSAAVRGRERRWKYDG